MVMSGGAKVKVDEQPYGPHMSDAPDAMYGMLLPMTSQ